MAARQLRGRVNKAGTARSLLGLAFIGGRAAGGGGVCTLGSAGKPRPGLEEGEAGRRGDATALLVVLEQLLQSLQVERVVVADLLLRGAEALGHGDGAAHYREGHPVSKRPPLPTRPATGSSAPWTRHSPTVVMGTANGSRPQELAEKRPRPQKMQGEKPRSLLKATWHRYCQEPVAKAFSLKMSFSPKEYTGTREALGRVARQEGCLPKAHG